MAFRDKYIKEAEEKLSKWREGSEEYEACLKYYRDFINSLDYAYDNGWKEGFEEGMEKCVEEGKALANVENARKMKVKGYSFSDIADITGLTIEEIETL